MSLNYSNLPEWLQWIIGAAAVILAGIGFIRKVWPILTRFVNTINSLGELPESLADMKKFRIDTAQSLAAQDATLEAQNVKIDQIHHEVNYNNGSSVKDAVSRVEVIIGKNSDRLSVMEGNQERIEKGVAGLYARVDANELAATEDRALIEANRKELEDTRPAVRRRTTKPKGTTP